MRHVSILLILAVAAAGYGFSLFKKDDRNILQKDSHTWVKVRNADKKVGSLDHPVSFADEQMMAALASIYYFKPAPLSIKGDKGSEFEIFEPEEREFIAPYLAQAFERAGSDEWVDFSYEYFRGKTFIGVFRLTSGVMFVKDGELNIVFREINSAVNPEERITELNPLNNYKTYMHLVPREGQRLYITQGKRNEIEHENWIIMPLSLLDKPVSLQVEKETVIEQKPVPVPSAPAPTVSPEQPAPAVSAPAPAAPAVAPAPPQKPAPAPVVERSAKERMLDLRELYDAGFISEEEYEQKRKEILEDL